MEGADEAPARAGTEGAEEVSEEPGMESLDAGGTTADPETALLADLEEKDLEDVAS